MRVVFRADSSTRAGAGHVMRSLALADRLAESGAEILFLCRDEPGNLNSLVAEKGYRVLGIGNDGKTDGIGGCDWLVVDHYELDEKWEKAMRPQARLIMAIDDLADRKHDCDLILDQNFETGSRYGGLVPESAQGLFGPSYALLRKEFSIMRERMGIRDGSIRRILVFFGGSDATDETSKALEGIRMSMHAKCHVDVIAGSSNPNRSRLETLCSGLPDASFHCQVNDMARFMMQADLSVGAGGTSTWERCCLGLPSLVTVLADNQEMVAETVASKGAILNLGRSETLASEDYRRALDSLDEGKMKSMSGNGLLLVDGKGCERVASVLWEMFRSLQ